MRNEGRSLYGGLNPRDVPVYGIAEAAGYLGIPVSTLRSWTVGQHYRRDGEWRDFNPIIGIPRTGENLLSFTNICEAHVCDALRRVHDIPFQRIRSAIHHLREWFPERTHPLIENSFATSGVELFVERASSLINLTQPGQVAIREILNLYLKRVEFDEQGLAHRLFPFTWRTERPTDSPRVVVLDPCILFGRPALVGSRIATSIVYERWAAGESVQTLAADYCREVQEIEEALRCEQYQQAA
ncbi:MAG: DUF433 domain-containing protein [Candidatus Eisenbacteria bacterium]|nr:DUF433 domain-containing protein [Candidatus Eisenbacteria bacterium]